jgi:hypothetical protein
MSAPSNSRDRSWSPSYLGEAGQRDEEEEEEEEVYRRGNHVLYVNAEIVVLYVNAEIECVEYASRHTYI